MLPRTGGTFLAPLTCPTRKVDSGGTSVLRGGQPFEAVKWRMVEDGPERTTLISTWRVHIAEATDGRREGREVYYLNAMDYAAEEARTRS